MAQTKPAPQAKELDLIDQVLSRELPSSIRGEIMALRKTGAFDDEIRDKLRLYAEEKNAEDSCKAAAKEHKENADDLLDAIRSLRSRADDLGDLVTLAVSETLFIEETASFLAKNPRAHHLAFNPDFGEAADFEAEEIGEALTFVIKWDALRHFPKDRRHDLESMQREKADAHAASVRIGSVRKADVREATDSEELTNAIVTGT